MGVSERHTVRLCVRGKVLPMYKISIAINQRGCKAVDAPSKRCEPCRVGLLLPYVQQDFFFCSVLYNTSLSNKLHKMVNYGIKLLQNQELAVSRNLFLSLPGMLSSRFYPIDSMDYLLAAIAAF